MYDYIKGEVVYICFNYIVLDNNGIGYKIYISNPSLFKKNETVKLYIYHYIKENESSLYGFKSIEEKDLFLKLIDVKGLGCKIALSFFSFGTINDLKQAIEEENILYLKKFPKIGDKIARQIILDLKGKLVTNNCCNDELIDSLKGLGYKMNEINKIIKNIDNSKPFNDQIKDALKLLFKN